jgi:hypothetical protein
MTIVDRILGEAPPGFSQRFLSWVRSLEDTLLVRFASWYPADAEGVKQHAHITEQQMTTELQNYYRVADPFGSRENGWLWWYEREQKYRAAWLSALIDIQKVTPGEGQRLINASPPLWPIDCFDRAIDRVGFIWQDDKLAIMELCLEKFGIGSPFSVGLRNYFLRDIVLEALAEEEPKNMVFDERRKQSAISAVSGWPETLPFPEHVALTIGKLVSADSP